MSYKYKMDIQSLRAGFCGGGGNITALAENGRTWLVELGRTLRLLLRHWQTAVRLRQIAVI